MSKIEAHAMDRQLDKYIDNIIAKMSYDDLVEIVNDVLRDDFFNMLVTDFLEIAEPEGFNNPVPDYLVEANKDKSLYEFINMVEKMETA
jgi:hypothetical protein